MDVIMSEKKDKSTRVGISGKKNFDPFQKGYQPTHSDLDDAKPPRGGSGVLKKNARIDSFPGHRTSKD